ncbi:MAG: response regulator [Lachnospiraceae bacterium]|nr:response regulator [Lachnospiraceae bacterium]
MTYQDIINSRFSEPAAILSYRDDAVRILYINDKFLPEHWMNVAEEDYIASYPHKTFDEENMRIYMDAIKRCAASGKEQIAETWRSVFSDCCGFDKVCLKSRLILVEKKDGEAIIFEGIRNISNEKRTQDTLDDIEYRYKNASEQINIYNWEYIIATKEMRPCYRCMRDLGLPAVVKNYPEPVIDAGIFPQDYADKYRDFMRQIDAGAPQMEIDIPLTVGRIPFRIKYTTEYDENGKPVKAFGSATLISDTELGRIKLDNQIIAKLAEEYTGIYLADFVNDEVKIVKQDGVISLPEDSKCDDLAALFTAKMQDVPQDQRMQVCDSRVMQTVMFSDCEKREFVFKDEKEDRWVRIDYHAIDREDGKVNRVLITTSIIDDFRAQKMNADRLIAAQKEELEDRQKMLLEAIDVANRANKAKTVFFSNMSHDIRTPMNAITGFSKLALEEIDNRENVKEYLDKISSAGDHLMSLINDILDMSRIESGKMEMSPTPVVVKELLTGCADMMRIKMDEKKQRFVVDVDKMGDDVVECDKLRFDQVILNLLSNAYKYTQEGGSVFLEGELLERGDVLTYEIRVRDTGIGMSKEFCDHIWEAFSREETDIVRETQGTGLGMVIVRNIVNLMQGTIQLVSEPGKGSEFTIVLPMKLSEGKQEENSPDREKEDALKKNYAGTTLLVVDDTQINLMLADRVLRKYGFTMRLVESGIEALDMVKNAKPGDIDLILMDVMMPVMDGLEATKRIRALSDPRLAGIPIIAMTANAFESYVREALDAGMDDYIAKPYKPEDIVPLINANLKKD